MLVAALTAVIIVGVLTPIPLDVTSVDVSSELVSNCSVGGLTLMQSIVNHPWDSLTGGSSAVATLCTKVDIVGMAKSTYSSVRKFFSTPAVEVIVSQRGNAMAPFRAKLWQQ